MNMQTLLKKYIDLNEKQKQVTEDLSDVREKILIALENKNAMKVGNYCAVVKEIERENINKALLLKKYGREEIKDCYTKKVYKRLEVIKVIQEA